MSTHVNLLGEPAPTLLPSLPEAEQLMSAGTPATEIAAKYPAFSLAWALLAEAALADNRYVGPRRGGLCGPAVGGHPA